MKKWTMEEIAAANAAAGYFFFSEGAMSAFGDCLENHAVEQRGDRVFIVQEVSTKGFDGKIDPTTLGRTREFFPETGRIRNVYKDSISRA